MNEGRYVWSAPLVAWVGDGDGVGVDAQLLADVPLLLLF
jgi:hypothetical protein